MDDDIELPPLPPVLGAPGMNLWIDDLRRAAVLADRERQAEKAKPVVHWARVILDSAGYAWSHGGAAECPPPGSNIITLRWTDDGRAWIDSKRNQELAESLRGLGFLQSADALDGGVR